MNAESDGQRKVAEPMAAGAVTGDGTHGPDAVAAGATAVGPKSAGGEGEAPLGSRAPRFIRASRPLHLSWQVGVFLAGLAIVAGGVVMLPLPGPGWLVIFAGMAVWATEFVWAQLVLRWTKRKVTAAAQRAFEPQVRRRNVILTTVGLVIVAVALAVYLWQFGFEMPWNVGT